MIVTQEGDYMYFGHNEEDEEVKSNPLVKLLTKKNIFIGLGILLALIIIIIVIVVISNSVKNNKNYSNLWGYAYAGTGENAGQQPKKQQPSDCGLGNEWCITISRDGESLRSFY